MVQQILDLHIHSKYSRACSQDLELEKIASACARKGVDIIATSDFTHPKWFEHIKTNLKEINDFGIYQLKSEILNSKSETNSKLSAKGGSASGGKTKFLLGTELSCIKKHKGETRRIHLCVFAPDIETAEKFNKKLDLMGFNLKSDGRPILGLTAKELLEIMLEVDERMVMVPAHAWTPWFGIFGSYGGYDSLEECFEELTPKIFAIETGLSSDPLMNWRLSKLDNIALISNSDAHSCAKIGREANVMQFGSEQEITYNNIFKIIKEGDRSRFLYTIEFYPEEGKYHYDGHRACQFVCGPKETKRLGGICPKCKKELTIGVMNRVEELSDRGEDEAKKINKIPYKNLVPLAEIIADVLDMGVNSKAVQAEYNGLIKAFGNEFNVLLNISISDIEKASSGQMAQAIERVRKGSIYVKPGYDGEFGVVKVFQEGEKKKSKQSALEF